MTEDPNLWNDPAKAQALMRERTKLEQTVSLIKDMDTQISDLTELIELGEAEGDQAIVTDSIKQLNELRTLAQRKQLESLLSGEADGMDCYLQINAGSGGTEAQDWAEMLLRMYMRWAEAHDYKLSVLERSDGEVAGIKSTTMKLEGPDAYGWLKTESGVHRLVRISPYDSGGRRHTSFASVSVSPVIDETIDIEILDKDLKVDTYRSQGAGGQHVNTTDSAVRITHLPSGIVVACQNERSQHQNRAQAMEMLRAKMYEVELRKREESAAEEHGEKTDIGWGHQIRSYVLHPYQLVKDLRTEVETNQSDKVLDGDLDMFLEASLAHKLTKDQAA